MDKTKTDQIIGEILDKYGIVKYQESFFTCMRELAKQLTESPIEVPVSNKSAEDFLKAKGITPTQKICCYGDRVNTFIEIAELLTEYVSLRPYIAMSFQEFLKFPSEEDVDCDLNSPQVLN